MNILILDTETTGVDPRTDVVVELGWVLWSPKFQCILSAATTLVDEGKGNAAEAVNGIPPEALLHIGYSLARAIDDMPHEFVIGAVMAHNAEFDRSFLPGLYADRPWICSQDDVDWPRPSTSRSLVALALAHGVGVAAAHRALDDCLTLARLLERAAEMTDIDALLARALRPRATFRALVSYDGRDAAKNAGFRWFPEAKEWRRRMAREDVAALSFDVREVQP